MTTALQPIWPNQKQISVIGVTGKIFSGKTLFLMTIDPAHTRLYDIEKSSSAYQGLGVDRIDVPDELIKRHKNGYSQRQLFEYWYEDVKKITPGQYSVIAIDPASDIEDGLVEWVKARYKEFGFSSPEKFEAMSGVFWGKVRAEWKKILVELSTKCQTFAFSTHLKTIWKNNKPTDKSAPKGKTTLAELATLYLFMDRDPCGKDKQPPKVPAAIVIKSRLATTVIADGEIIITPILPPRLPKATPEEIRKYILAPPSYDKLKAGEKLTDKPMSEEEKLEIQREIADNQRAAAEAQFSAYATQASIEDAKAKARERLKPTPDQSHKLLQDIEDAKKKEVPVEIEDPEGEDPGAHHDEQTAYDLRTEAGAAGVLIRVQDGINRALKTRGVEIDVLKWNADLLTSEEFTKFKNGVESVKNKSAKA